MPDLFRIKYLLLTAASLMVNFGLGQPRPPSLPSQIIPLQDLSSFQTTKNRNWNTKGSVSSDRKISGNLSTKEGNGILVFESEEKRNHPIATKQEFGDLDLELDFLLAKGSSFTVLIQNKYPVTLSDLWMLPGNEAFKAPGLWQHLRVQFRAPTFDAYGKKVTNALLEEISLNGQPLKIPAQPATGIDDKPVGALRFLGTIGPFAIRNIRYKTYSKDKIELSDIAFKVYQGLHKNPDTLKTLKPKRTGVTDTLSHRVGDRKSQLAFDGTINVPIDGEYMFKLTAGGGAWLFIDQKPIISNKGTRDFEKAFYEKTTLKKGKYAFKIVYSNSDECLVLGYEGPQIRWQYLTTPSSVRLSEHFEPLEYVVKNKPVLQRGFMMHRDKVNPYTAAVGLPKGNNYAYDMKKYNLLATWHGKFIDVSNMWRERGEKQLEIPLGAKLEFTDKPLIAKLENETSSWPDSVQTPEAVFDSRAYKITESGLPVYLYRLNQNSIEDLIYATTTNDGLTRDLKIITTNPERTYIMLAEGNVIEKLPNGAYAIDDKSYYIENLEIGKATATIRQDKNTQQLIIPVSSSNEILTIKYNIIW